MKLVSHTCVKTEQPKQNHRYLTIAYHSGMLVMQKTTLSLFCEWYINFQNQQTESESSKTGTFLPALISHMNYLCDYNGNRTHNHLVYKRTLNHLAKLALSVRLQTKWLWVRVPL